MIDQQMMSDESLVNPMGGQQSPQSMSQPSPMQAMAMRQEEQPVSVNTGLDLNNPQLNEMVDPIIQEIVNSGISVDEITKFINLLKFSIDNPDAYPQVRKQLIDSGTIDDSDLPQHFDAKYITALLITFKIIEKKLQSSEESPEGMARGGLAKLAAKGRRGDTMLAHIGPAEDKILKSYGGSGAINPNTGLPEYGFFKSISKVVKKVAPIAIPVMMVALPGVGTAIGAALGASGVGATILGGAVLGGGLSAVTGGNVLQGAAFGGLAGGLAPAIGGGIDSALGLGLSSTGQAAIGGALVGGGIGYGTTGTTSGALKGTLIGGAASGAGQALSGAAGAGSALASGAGAAARVGGAALTAGYNPKQAALSALSAGALQGLQYQSPTDTISGTLGANATNPDGTPAAGRTVSLNTPQTNQFDFTRMSAPALSGQGGIELGYNPISEIGTPTFGADGSMSYGVTPSVQAADATEGLTNYGKYGYAEAPGTVTTDELGRSGEIGINAKTGAPEFKPYQGNFQFDPNSNSVVYKTAEPSMLDKFSAGFSGNEVKPPFVEGTSDTGTPWGKYAMYGGLGVAGLSALSGKSAVPQEVQPEVSKLPEAQQEYFYRPSVTWDWTKMQQDAAANNLTLSQYMARNWGDVTSGKYNNPISTATEIPTAARGGALSKIAHFAQGAGTGRSDEIDAKLSDGEYVIDAETVALLGDGSSKAGAEILDKLREEIRKQKGKALAKGKISPNAKSPLSYLKGVK